MTNDRFLAFLYNILNIGIAPMSDEQDAYEHAKKLVAIVEASEDVAANPHNNFDKILILRGKLQDLKSE